VLVVAVIVNGTANYQTGFSYKFMNGW